MKKVTRIDTPTDTLDTSGRRYRADKVSKIARQIIKQTPKQPTFNDYCDLERKNR
jgi:hypothetical protein